jgi:hypothetical protein
MQIRRTAAVCVIAAGLATTPFALGAPIVTTIRVEGSAANVLPETSLTIDDAPTAIVVADTTDADTIAVAAASATSQLATATTAFGLPFGFDLFNFGGPSAFPTRIGTDTAVGPTYNPFWRLRVNGLIGGSGADTTILRAGDSVTWAFVSDFSARELDLSVSADKVAQGQSFEVSVKSVDNAGVAVPAVGATITYGDQVATADALGKASLPTTGVGVRLVSATRVGEVRSQSRAVCSYGPDPAVCNLPPIRPTTSSAASDTVAPGSEIAFPVSGRRYRVVRSLRGSAGPDRSDIATVEVAIARRVGTQCRFMGPKGGFSEPRLCTERRLIPARSSGSHWVFPIPVTLLPGKYRAWSRAADGAGNREVHGIAPINSISFIVLSKGAAR